MPVLTIWQDLKFGVRVLFKRPSSTLAAIMALAFGIGANTAIFSIVNVTLLRPLPGIDAPDQLVLLERLQRGRLSYSFGYPDYRDYRDLNQSFSELAARVGTPLSFSQDVTEQIRGDLVTGNYFTTLGVRPALGRLLAPVDDGLAVAQPVAVLSYGFWQRAFGADGQVIGRSITINGHRFTVVGVAAKDFHGISHGSSVDVWLPMATQPIAIPRMSPDILDDRSAGWLGLFGRLKPGIGLEQAQAEMQNIARQLEQNYPVSNAGRSLQLIRGLGYFSSERASLRSFLGLLTAAVALLLLSACGNVAALLLARAAARRREIAVRLALGATRSRLIRQLVSEGLILSLVAGCGGLLLAPWMSSLIASFQQTSNFLRGLDTSPNWQTMSFALGLSMLTGILFSIAPAVQSSKTDLTNSLKDGAAASSRRGSRLQDALVIAQVALSLVLLIGAGLVFRTMREALTVDRGFKHEDILLMSVDLSIQGYSEERGISFYQELLKRLAAMPGVISVSLAKTVPPNEWSDRISVFYEGQNPPQDVLRGRDDLGVRVEANRIAPHYFETLGIPLRTGREFSAADREGAPAVAIINEKLAQRLWPGENALGKRLSVPFYSGPSRPPVEIIGIAKDTKHRSLLLDAPYLLYLPESQAYDGRATIALRTATDPTSLIEMVRQEVAALDKNLPLLGVKTMPEQIASTLSQQRIAANCIGLFGLIALLLAAIGLYGMIAHFVTQGTREIGIRIALGAQPSDVLREVMKRGLRVTVIGMVIGLATAAGLTNLMKSLLYGVSPTDPLTFGIAAVFVLAGALVACYFPARAAMRVDPIVALRAD